VKTSNSCRSTAKYVKEKQNKSGRLCIQKILVLLHCIFSCGKAVSVKYFECVSLGLIIQDA
jgi:hypothetical protein